MRLAAGKIVGLTALALVLGCSPPGNNSQPAQTAAAPPPVKDPVAEARLERVRQSLEHGLDVNKADPSGRTAVMMAAFEGYTEVVKLLLDHGAEVGRRDGAGRTAMMYASSGPFPQTVELLVQNGAHVNRADTAEGWTALMLAAAEGHQPVVEALLRHGAMIEMADQDGDTAVDHARERGQTHIVALLESWPGEQ
jgi:ankyrin repeat protein